MGLYSLNGYNQGEFEQKFKDSSWPQLICKLFGNDVVFQYDTVWELRNLYTTPRQNCLTKTFTVAPLYYLEFLLRQNPKRIADIGCGANFFKRLIPNIWGIDAEQDNTLADQIDFFDADFSRNHTEEFDCAFALNSLHYVPIDRAQDQILRFANIVKPGGRGFIALNVYWFVENTPEEDLLELFETIQPTLKQLANYFDNIIRNLDLNFIVVDNLIEQCYHEAMNGNIRLVFEK